MFSIKQVCDYGTNIKEMRELCKAKMSTFLSAASDSSEVVNKRIELSRALM
jgi:hypothetical protein